ncbi:MAG: bacillithiol biosynthesis cysteine-adding enzyme BshC [Spirosomataceae bacterium]
MTSQTFRLEDTHQFSKLFLDFINKRPELQPYFSNYPDLQGFTQQLQVKSFDITKRKVLVDTLQQQYANTPNPPDFSILLDEKTFTVTTGHQLNLFTGPLYVIYKLVTAINLAKQLKAAYPDYNFVPVHWLATEDHDFQEINHFSLFGKTYEWTTEQKGAVGRFQLDDFGTFLNELPEKPAVFMEAYTQQATLAGAARAYVHQLFGHEGLICLDGDARGLKALFAPVIKDELLHQTAFDLVNQQSTRLESIGYKTQVSPREINLFYLCDGFRERLIKEDGVFKSLHSDYVFSENEIIQLVDNEPESFSPNVILRGLYQESILPNIAYIGGPAEVAYWLQLKPIFDYHGVPFPIIMPRNFALYINAASSKRMDKLGVNIRDLFADEVSLRKSFVERNATNSLSLEAECSQLDQLFQQVLGKAIKVDKTLEAVVNGEKQKMLNALENLEKRLKKAEERNQETEVNQLLALKQKLFPGGGLQERSDNFLNFYLNNPDFLTQLLTTFDALDFSFYVLTE